MKTKKQKKKKKKNRNNKKKIVVGILNAVKHSIIDCYLNPNKDVIFEGSFF